MYVEGPPPLYISHVSPKQTRQDQYQETIEAVGDKYQRMKKVTQIHQIKQCKERGLQKETLEYGASMPSPQLTQQGASIGTGPMPLNCFYCDICRGRQISGLRWFYSRMPQLKATKGSEDINDKDYQTQ